MDSGKGREGRRGRGERGGNCEERERRRNVRRKGESTHPDQSPCPYRCPVHRTDFRRRLRRRGLWRLGLGCPFCCGGGGIRGLLIGVG